jgi:hypothetical protein
MLRIERLTGLNEAGISSSAATLHDRGAERSGTAVRVRPPRGRGRGGGPTEPSPGREPWEQRSPPSARAREGGRHTGAGAIPREAENPGFTFAIRSNIGDLSPFFPFFRLSPFFRFSGKFNPEVEFRAPTSTSRRSQLSPRRTGRSPRRESFHGTSTHPNSLTATIHRGNAMSIARRI